MTRKYPSLPASRRPARYTARFELKWEPKVLLALDSVASKVGGATRVSLVRRYVHEGLRRDAKAHGIDLDL